MEFVSALSHARSSSAQICCFPDAASGPPGDSDSVKSNSILSSELLCYMCIIF